MGLETGPMGRFPTVGHAAAYCRGGQRITISHGKRTGQGNGHKGHPARAWASRAAAPCAIRFSPTGPRWYQRHQAKSPRMVARKAVAPTRARAGSDILRELRPWEGHQAFGCGRAAGGVEGGDGEET